MPGDGMEIVGLHQRVGIKADQERIAIMVIEKRKSQIETDLARQADSLFGGNSLPVEAAFTQNRLFNPHRCFQSGSIFSVSRLSAVSTHVASAR